MNQIRVAVAGCGTVGSHFIEVLRRNRYALKQKTGLSFDLVAAADIQAEKGNLLPGRFFRDARQLVKEPDIDIIVELIGGIHPAYELVKEAILSGKSVVTANKALLSQYGEELMNLAAENRVYIGFEASVGGAIPIIKTVRESFVGTSIKRLLAILNGTTNYILSRMTMEKMPFAAALKKAQEKGYAEANPALDLSGMDTAHKLGILVRYLFHKIISWEKIPVEGIENIDQKDIEFASQLGYRIKLLAVADRRLNSLQLAVFPALLPVNHLLAVVEDVYNAIYLEGDLIGRSLLYGQGAGGKAAASAVLADVTEIGMKLNQGGYAAIYWPQDKNLVLESADNFSSRSYLRFTAVDRPGVLARIAYLLGKNNISIASVIQKDQNPRQAVPIVMLTHEAREKSFSRALKEINSLDIIRKPTVRIRMVE